MNWYEKSTLPLATCRHWPATYCLVVKWNNGATNTRRSIIHISSPWCVYPRHFTFWYFRVGELDDELKLSDGLLYQMVPRYLANNLKRDIPILPEAYESATLLNTDMVGFTKISSTCSPRQVTNMLNKFFTLFDERLRTFDVYKVETVGDGCMVASGNGVLHIWKYVLPKVSYCGLD